MAERKPGKFIVPAQGGAMRSFVNRLKLIGRLMGDRRVNIFLKALPVASLVYLISPIDAISFPIVGALDDAAVLWLGSTLFVELCPDDVVQEHRKAIESNLQDTSSDEVVDAESTDVNDS